jgi:hypothetical protein
MLSGHCSSIMTARNITSFFWLILFFLPACSAFGGEGCLSLTLEKKLRDNEYFLLFTVTNKGEDMIFEPAELLPWQADPAVFSWKFITDNKQEISPDKSILPRVQGISALLPRETLHREIRLTERFFSVTERLKQNRLHLFWRYRSKESCPEQKGTLALEQIK